VRVEEMICSIICALFYRVEMFRERFVDPEALGRCGLILIPSCRSLILREKPCGRTKRKEEISKGRGRWCQVAFGQGFDHIKRV